MRLAPETGDSARLFAQLEAQREARAQAHEASLAEQRSVIARARLEMHAALETRTKLAGALPVLVEQERAFERLAREGYAGKLMLAQRSRERPGGGQGPPPPEAPRRGARPTARPSERARPPER